MSVPTNGKLGETSYKVPTSEISCDSLSAIRSPEFPRRSSPVGRSVGRSVLVKLRGGESCSRAVLGFFIGNYPLSPSIAIHPYGGNKAPNKRFRADGPNVRTENPILAYRAARLVRVPPLLLIASSPPFPVFSFDPSASRSLPFISLPTFSFYFLIHPFYSSFSSSFSSSISLRTHSRIHKNWSLTTAKYYHIPIKIISSLLLLSLSFFFRHLSFTVFHEIQVDFRVAKEPFHIFRQIEKNCVYSSGMIISITASYTKFT